MTEVKIEAGICGFTTRVRSEDQGTYKAAFQIESDCPNWTAFNEILGGQELNVTTELFKNRQTGKVDSRVLELALETIPHVLSCPVLSGLFKAMEVSVGMALPRDAVIAFTSSD